MKLFFRPGSCSMAPYITFHELGLPFQPELVDRETQRTRPSGIDYKALSPKPYVPALQLDDGQLLTENAAILQYIADQRPEKKLAPPAGTLDRYRLQEWLHFIGTELHKTVSPLFNPRLPEEMKKGTRDRFYERLGIVEKALERQPYLMGQQLTVADPYANVILSWHPKLGLDLTAFPKTKAYHQNFMERPAVRTAFEAAAKAQQ
ncbi:MAG: glutathione transferase GstA [Myxococcales bacterium]